MQYIVKVYQAPSLASFLGLLKGITFLPFLGETFLIAGSALPLESDSIGGGLTGSILISFPSIVNGTPFIYSSLSKAPP